MRSRRRSRCAALTEGSVEVVVLALPLVGFSVLPNHVRRRYAARIPTSDQYTLVYSGRMSRRPPSAKPGGINR